jgi:hypothetical protein
MPPTITSILTASVTEGTAFSYQITASGSLPIAFEDDNLPAGLAFSGDTISGTPTVNGVAAIRLSATNTAGSDAQILLLTIAPASGTIPPVPNVDSPPASPAPAPAGQPVMLTVSASDPGVDLLLYAWNFGDGTTDLGATAMHTYASPGIYTASVTISNGVNSTTVTVPVVIDAPGITVNPAEFAVTKHLFSFDFSKINSDSLELSGKLPVPLGFALGGQSMTVMVGGYTSVFTLSANGRGHNSTDRIKLSGKLKKSVSAASTLNFSYAVKKQNLLASLQAYGLSNANVSGQSISLPVLMDLDNEGFLANIAVTYTAKRGKSGTAR